MTKEQIMVELFEFSAPTYYKWTKKEKRKIFDLLNYAFTLEELEEFITTGKINNIEIMKNSQGLIFKVKEFFEKLINISNVFIARNVFNIIKKQYIKNNKKLDFEKLRFELFYLNVYYYMECANEDFLSKLNDFEFQYDEDIQEIGSTEFVMNRITLDTKYQIISHIEETPKEILEFALNLEIESFL